MGEMTRLFGRQANNPVPPGFVVLASAFDRFLKETDLNAEIEARLKEVNPEDTNTVDKASNVIRDAIHDHAMPKDLEDEILKAFDELFAAKIPPNPPLLRGEQYVAVRSSATAEDSAVASWAGELETYLNTTRENVAKQVKNCWSSLFTPRAIFYRHEKKYPPFNPPLDKGRNGGVHVSVAVVVQKMIQSEISGVAFTVHPVTEDPNQMIIEACFGLGEAIVSGQITPDSYVVHKKEMSILDINVGVQSKKLKVKSKKSKDDDEMNEWIELNESEGGKQKLNGKQIIELAKICQKIEQHYKFPCDIEWAYEGGKFYITQSRPITTLKK